MNEDGRLAICRRVAVDMYAAGMGDCYDAIERLTRPAIVSMEAIRAFQEAVSLTPYERGVLDRYQNRKRRHSS